MPLDVNDLANLLVTMLVGGSRLTVASLILVRKLAPSVTWAKMVG